MLKLNDKECKAIEEYSMSLSDLNHTIVGEVVYGEQLARKLGCPTANLMIDLPLASGIYGGYVDVPRLNINNAVSLIYIKDNVLEAHLIDRDLNLYGLQLVVRLKCFVRPPVAWISAAQMTLLIQDDLKLIRATLR